MTVDKISIHGAREHNLRNVSLDIPKKALTVITGLSGSGKSSLAFDTIYAEGQRRYVESLSAYARQFLNLSKKPDVERIEGLSPAIAIEQKSTSKNPRSTVGTITEIYDYLRLLYAQVGTPYCPTHNIEITSLTVSQIVDEIMKMETGTRLHILAPVVQGRKGEYRKEFIEWQKQGFSRVQIDGELYEIDETPTLDKNKKHSIEVLVDRLVVKYENLSRISDSVETALKLANETVIVQPIGKGEQPPAQTFSARNACPKCHYAVAELEPRLFSFNSPFGACETCSGLGEITYFSPDLIVPDPALAIDEGAIKPWQAKDKSINTYYTENLANHYKFNLATPFEKLPKKIQDILLYGSGTEKIKFVFETKGNSNFTTHKPFEGVIPILEKRWKESNDPMGREDLNRFRTAHECPGCEGNRLCKDALAVKIYGKNIMETTNLSIEKALKHFDEVNEHFTGSKKIIAQPIIKEIKTRLEFLNHVGLGYLTLSRRSGTLSGGESQRIRLASQIGSGLTGVLYVLDEPSIGLHQRDNQRLLEMLLKLRDMDNTILVVEHDEDAIRSADHIVDIGPGAGEHGGLIVAEGDKDAIMAVPHSITGQYLSGARKIDVPKRRRKANKFLEITECQKNNLKKVDAAFPIGLMTCITGVSGSGKSTLVMDTLYNAVDDSLNKRKTNDKYFSEIKGLDNIDKIIHIDQSPIGRTPRSNPATYTGVMDPIRKWFAGLPEAKEQGYKAGRFSFNVKGGRCEACSGDGTIKVEMHFLADVHVECDVCKGKRYNRETLAVKYKGKSIADVLDMPAIDALEFFKSIPSIKNKLNTLCEVGLGYVRLGQSALTLSGGEAQRMKLSKELTKRSTGKTLYILDEPTTGLHFEDIKTLLGVLHKLVDGGNTMLIIEHNLDVIKTADWIVDIGPEGGDGGGKIIASGTPEAIAKISKSYTGQYVQPLLN
jgi:excinuclease ABC subunit A